MLATLGALEALEAREHTLAFFQICLPLLGLGLEILAARLVGSRRSLLKALPVRRRITDDSLADRFPIFLQLFDPIRQRLRPVRRSDKGRHFLDQFSTLGRDGIVLPFLELVESHV